MNETKSQERVGACVAVCTPLCVVICATTGETAEVVGEAGALAATVAV